MSTEGEPDNDFGTGGATVGEAFLVGERRIDFRVGGVRSRDRERSKGDESSSSGEKVTVRGTGIIGTSGSAGTTGAGGGGGPGGPS